MKGKKVITIIVIVAGVAIVLVKFFGGKKKIDNLITVNETDRVKIDSITTKVSVDGIVDFKDNIFIYPHESKRIDKINVKVGDEVKKGDVLAQYSSSNLDSLKQQLSEAKINLNDAKINLESLQLPATDSELSSKEMALLNSEKNISDLKAQITQYDIQIEQLGRDIETAKSKYENNKLLYESGGISKNDLDNSDTALKKLEDDLETTKTRRQTTLESITTAEKNYDLTKVQYEAEKNKTSDSKTRKQIEQANLRIEQANLKIQDLNKKIKEFEPKEISRVNGKVIAVNATDGDMASDAKYIFQIADTSINNLVVKLDVPENSAEEIEVNQNVEIQPENSKEISSGVITKVYPVAEKSQTKTTNETILKAEAQITNPKSEFKKGYNIDARIITSNHDNVLVIPLMSTFTEDDKDYTYTVDKNSVVHKKNIKIISSSDTNVEIQGLEKDEIVIVNPDAQIKDGIKVKLNNINQDLPGDDKNNKQNGKNRKRIPRI